MSITKIREWTQGSYSDQYHSKPFRGWTNNSHMVHIATWKMVVTPFLQKLRALCPEFALGLVTYPKQPKWGSVTKIRYFGTYLRYLPTNPTSHHCDNIPANPSWITDIFRYHFRISTSSSTVELVRFFLETLELVMHPCLQNSILSKSLLG